MPQSFYNTTHLAGVELEQEEGKAKRQESMILEYFMQHKDEKFSGSDIYINLGFDKINTPLTSIRRANTNLMNQNKIIKLKEKKIGLFGKAEYLYTLNKTIFESKSE
jgi:hypothetical protein